MIADFIQVSTTLQTSHEIHIRFLCFVLVWLCYQFGFMIYIYPDSQGCFIALRHSYDCYTSDDKILVDINLSLLLFTQLRWQRYLMLTKLWHENVNKGVDLTLVLHCKILTDYCLSDEHNCLNSSAYSSLFHQNKTGFMVIWSTVNPNLLWAISLRW